MRHIIIISFFLTVCFLADAQQRLSFVYTDSLLNSFSKSNQWAKVLSSGKQALKSNVEFYNVYYSLGLSYFNLKMYLYSTKYFRKAYEMFPSPEVANYMYYSLLYSGLDIDAVLFAKQHTNSNNKQRQYKQGVESWLFDVGQRFSSQPQTIGNLFYSDLLLISRPNASTKLEQSVIYLQQNNQNNSYSQGEYFILYEKHNNAGWIFNPVVHYALTLYKSSTTGNNLFNDTVIASIPPNILANSITKGNLSTKYTTSGSINSINTAFGVSKRRNIFTFGFEPAFQLILNKYTYNYIYGKNGKTDSFVNNHYVNTRPYFDTLNYSKDTGNLSIVGQVGASLKLQLPMRNFPAYTKIAGYYLFDNKGKSAYAFSAYAVITKFEKLWLHFGFIYKGNLPLCVNTDGLYMNSYIEIKARTSTTIQFFPLKHFSPMLTYQYEVDNLDLNNQRTNYNSVYLTIKYNI